MKMEPKRKQTYAEALVKDRDLYLRHRNKLAELGCDLIDRIGDRGQEDAVKKFRDYVETIGIERE